MYNRSVYFSDWYKKIETELNRYKLSDEDVLRILRQKVTPDIIDDWYYNMKIEDREDLTILLDELNFRFRNREDQVDRANRYMNMRQINDDVSKYINYAEKSFLNAEMNKDKNIQNDPMFIDIFIKGLWMPFQIDIKKSDLYEKRYHEGISKVYEKVLILEKIETDPEPEEIKSVEANNS